MRVPRKFQSTLEYATLITIVVGALLWMKGWMQKGLQGKFQVVGKQLGDQWDHKSTQESSMHVTSSTRETNTSIQTDTQSQSSTRTQSPGVGN